MVTSTIRDELNIITVVLGADTKKIRSKDSVTLIEYVYNNYEQVNIKELINEEFEKWKTINEKNIYINKGIKDIINIRLGDSKYEKYSVRKEKIKDIKVEISCTNYLEAPIEKNKPIGNLKLKLDNDVIEVIDIFTDEEIGKKNVLDYLYEVVSKYDIILKQCVI